jgi:hypothetical protein
MLEIVSGIGSSFHLHAIEVGVVHSSVGYLGYLSTFPEVVQESYIGVLITEASESSMRVQCQQVKKGLNLEL